MHLAVLTVRYCLHLGLEKVFSVVIWEVFFLKMQDCVRL